MNTGATIQEYKVVSNGLTSASTTLKLGGSLTADTTVDGSFTLTLGTDAVAIASPLVTIGVGDTLIINSSGGFYGNTSKTRWYEKPLPEFTASTSGNATVLSSASISNGEAVTIEILWVAKDDSVNQGAGGRHITTWTKAAGTLVHTWSSDTDKGTDTGSTFNVTTADSGGNIAATLTRVTGGNVSWSWIARIIHRKP